MVYNADRVFSFLVKTKFVSASAAEATRESAGQILPSIRRGDSELVTAMWQRYRPFLIVGNARMDNYFLTSTSVPQGSLDEASSRSNFQLIQPIFSSDQEAFF